MTSERAHRLPARIFRAYDIRGIVGDALTSRLRGNDVTDAFAVIPAKAGIHRTSTGRGCRASPPAGEARDDARETA